MNKFLKNLTATNEKIKSERAKMITNQAERAKRKQIEDLTSEIENKEFRLAQLNDLSPTNTTDLSYREDFNPSKWANETSNLLGELYTLKVQKEILLRDYNNWFSEEKSNETKNEVLKPNE